MRKHETIDPFSTFTIMRHGVSTTDRCLGWDATERMLRQGHEARAKSGQGVRSNGMTGAVLKQFLYGYDQAGNRTSEQIDLGVTGANYNNVNQLTTTIGGGPVRFVGHLDEPGTVLIGTNAATMGLQSTSFVGFAQTTLGTNVVTITATDYSSNSRTNRYQVVITNTAWPGP